MASSDDDPFAQSSAVSSRRTLRSGSTPASTVPASTSTRPAHSPAETPKGRRGVKRRSWWPIQELQSAVSGPRIRPELSQETSVHALEDRNEPQGARNTRPGYALGPELGSAPVKCITNCLARREGTHDYYMARMLVLPTDRPETQDERHGKMLLHTEQALLALLCGERGVIRMHDLVKDTYVEEKAPGQWVRLNRITLILDCLVPNLYCPNSQDFVSLQQHVIKQKRLPEKEALGIFYHIVSIVCQLHQRNVIHRDLKLGNVVLDRRSQTVILTNFCLGKHLMSDQDLLTDQRGSPAYISPDVLSGKPYLGKPSDVWALGVVLFTMLYGQFPFYHSLPQELFNKIKSASFKLHGDVRVSEECKGLIKKILVVDPAKRLTAPQLLREIESVISVWRSISPSAKGLQVVPEYVESAKVKKDQKDQKPSAAESANAEIFFNFIHATDRSEMEPLRGKLARGSDAPNSRGAFPVTRINTDARDLTDEEYRRFGPLISQMRQNNAHSNSSTGQPLANTSNSSEGSSIRGIAQMASPVLVSENSPLISVLRRQNQLRTAPPGPITPAASPVPGMEEVQALDLSNRPTSHGPTVMPAQRSHRLPPVSTRRYPANSAPVNAASGRAPGQISLPPSHANSAESQGLRGLRAALDQMNPASVASNDNFRHRNGSSPRRSAS